MALTPLFGSGAHIREPPPLPEVGPTNPRSGFDNPGDSHRPAYQRLRVMEAKQSQRIEY
jgi:hypothetical protein